MAVYIGYYYDDFGNPSYSQLRVGLITNVTLLTSRGRFELTDGDFDNEYLPDIFKNNYPLKTGRSIPECKSGIIKRFAKLYLSNSEYLKIELPFIPNSTEFNQFFIDAYFRNLSSVQSIGYEGEFQPNYHLKRFA